MAEPLILLTGVVLWRLCRLYKKTKINKNRRKIATTTFRERAARKQLDFSIPGVSWRRFWRPRSVPGCSQAPLLASQVALVDPLGDPGPRRRRPETLPRRSRDAFRMLLGTTRRPERVAGSILSRFWMLRNSSGQLSGSIWDRFSNDWPKKID